MGSSSFMKDGLICIYIPTYVYGHLSMGLWKGMDQDA